MASNVMSCDYCGAEFTDLPTLLDHEEAHRVAGNQPLMGFPCDQCLKVYKNKKDLTRHQKTKHSDVTYPCVTCGKTFGYVGAKSRHEKHCQGKENICETCGKRCSTAGGLRRHQDLHNKALQQKQTPQQPIKRKSSQSRQVCKAKKGKTVLSKPSSYRCRRCNDIFPNRHELYLHGMQHHYQVGGGLQPRPWNQAPWEHQDGTVDEDLKQVYEANAPLILGPDQPGPIQSIYNFPVSNDVSILQLNRFAAEIYDREQRAFKMNLSFGMILQHKETGQYRYFTPYRNNTIFESPIYISKRTDLRRLYLRLRRIDILDQLLRNRPDTKWVPVLATNVEFYVTGTNYALGQGDLPQYILNKRSIHALDKNRGKQYGDNLCLFRCLALHRGHDVKSVDGPAQEFYRQWKDKYNTVEPFGGVSVDELPQFEEMFHVDVEMYSLTEDEVARSIYRSRGRFNNNLYVNLYENHASYIKNFAMYAKKFICNTCDRHFDHYGNFVRHQKICTNKTKFVYPGGFHKTQDSIFEKLEAFDIHVPLDQRRFPWFICYDFESVLQSTKDHPTPFLSWTQKHVPISVSVCSNVEGYTEPFCIVEPDQDKLIEAMVTYMKEIANSTEHLCQEKWGWVLEQLDQNSAVSDQLDIEKLSTQLLDESDCESEEEDGQEEEDCQVFDERATIQDLYGKMQAYMNQVPVLGFNSAKYDLNLIKQTLAKHLNMHTENLLLW